MPFDPNDPNFAVEMAGAPFHWQGDTGVLNWLGEFYDGAYNEGAGTVPAPTISGVAPSSATAGDPDIVLNVTGTGFVLGSTVQADAVDLATTFVNALSVQAVLPSENLASSGTLQITVLNPDSQTSGQFAFDVT